MDSIQAGRGFSATRLDVLYTMKVNAFAFQWLGWDDCVASAQRLIAAL
jgi:hypothetical protein